MNKKEITVIYKQPGQEPEQIKIIKDLKNYQDLVNGYIEIIDMPGITGVLILLNEEGKIYGMKPNIECAEYEDVFVGPIIFVGTDDNDELDSLTEEQTKAVLEYIEKAKI